MSAPDAYDIAEKLWATLEPGRAVDQLATFSRELYAAGRRDGIEDAAKVVDSFGISTVCPVVAEHVRTLGDA